MYVIIDDRENVTKSYASGFEREGVASIGFWSTEFIDWFQFAASEDLAAVDAFLLGDSDDRASFPSLIRKRSAAPIIALNNVRSLALTLDMFSAGVDDVICVPVHMREVLVRTAVIRRRGGGLSDQTASGAIQVFFDGRDPLVDGKVLSLPRRELRILEYMISHQGRWLTKSQMFSAIYGIFNSNFDESVIESHISKLRKKLRSRMGYDPILSKRYVGYQLNCTVTRLSGAEIEAA